MKTFQQRREEFYKAWDKASKQKDYQLEKWIAKRDALLAKGELL